MRKFFAPNRIAVYLAGAGALATAIAPIVADLNLEDTGGVVAGLVALLIVVNRFLVGWQKHEDRESLKPELAGIDVRPEPQPVSWNEHSLLADQVEHLVDRLNALEYKANEQQSVPVPSIVLDPGQWWFDPNTGVYRRR